MVASALDAQEVPPAPEGKAVVYFVRTSSLGFANGFAYFDSTRFIGKFSAPKYLRYECNPGHHIFWAKSENVDFVDATVEAGRIYFIYVDADAGVEKPIVKLEPVDPKNRDVMSRIFKLMNKKSPVVIDPEELAADGKEYKAEIKKALSQHATDSDMDGVTAMLTTEMYYPFK
jgi:hypothetical protein